MIMNFQDICDTQKPFLSTDSQKFLPIDIAVYSYN